jgi:hypothetical protein
MMFKYSHFFKSITHTCSMLLRVKHGEVQNS